MIRLASIQDIPGLVKLEMDCFATDRITSRNFRYLLTKAHGKIWLIESNKVVVGAAIVLMRKGSTVARLYSMAIAPQKQGAGLANSLLLAVENDIASMQYKAIILEVRADNSRAISFYKKQGYSPFGSYANYYEDRMDAIRMKKNLLCVTNKDTDGH